MRPSSTAPVAWTPEGRGRPHSEATAPSKSCASPARWSARKKWLIAASIVLALGAAVLGSMWLGFAAVLPLLYLLPCLAMVAMCMKGMNGNGSQRSGDT